jgi:hypothetical protein
VDGDPVCIGKGVESAEGCPGVRRSYKFLLRPTRKQEAALGACLEDTRQLYNAALNAAANILRAGLALQEARHAT